MIELRDSFKPQKIIELYFEKTKITRVFRERIFAERLPIK